MKINTDKLKKLIAELNRYVPYRCCSSSVFIGKTESGNLVRLEVISPEESEEQFDLTELNPDYKVIS